MRGVENCNISNQIKAGEFSSYRGDGTDVFSQVKREILTQIPKGGITKVKVVSRLKMSTRAFDRLLKENGYQFSSLLDELRAGLSVQYLSQGMDMEQVSELLGYADKSSFQRAFKQWHNLSPGKFINRITNMK